MYLAGVDGQERSKAIDECFGKPIEALLPREGFENMENQFVGSRYDKLEAFS